MNQKRLHCVARRRVLRLCVKNHGDCLFHIKVLIHINMTDTVGMSHYRNFRIVHYVLHKGV